MKRSPLIPRQSPSRAILLGTLALMVLAPGAGTGCKSESEETGPSCEGAGARLCVLDGVVKQRSGDFAGALVHYEQACAAGGMPGCVMAAHIYRDGLGGVAADKPKALSYYQRASEANDPGGAYHLGDAYRRGVLGLKRELHKARALLQSACSGGEADACAALADLKKAGR
jgi:TPR repeat protein